MNKCIGGALDVDAIAHLTGADARLRQFRLLTRDAQASAIKRLLATGLTDQDAAAATGLSVEQVRRAIAADNPSFVET